MTGTGMQGGFGCLFLYKLTLYILQMLNDSLHPVATIILLSNFKAASVTIEESLWPSQKAIILGTGVLMIWELVKYNNHGPLTCSHSCVLVNAFFPYQLFTLCMTADESDDEHGMILYNSRLNL